MDEPFLARKHFDEGAKVHQPRHPAQIDLANFDLADDGLDHGGGLLGGLLVDGGNQHASVLLDVDLDAGLGRDLVDDLAAWADDLSNLFGVDLDGNDPRRKGRQLGPRLSDHAGHGVQDHHAGLPGLFQRLCQNLPRQPFDFDIHLQRGDTHPRAGHLEVHVAHRIFEALDVGQHGDLPILAGDQAHGDAADRRLDGHARIHQGECRPAHGGHGGRAVGLQDFGHEPDGIREGCFVGDHRPQRPLNQQSVADLPPAWTAQRPHLAH